MIQQPNTTPPDDTDRLLDGGLADSPIAGGYDLTGRWRTPEALIDRGAELPPFPLEVLPPWIATYAASLSETTQTPGDLAGLLGLACLAVACAKRARVQVTPSWSEPLNLYAVCAMAASERKSPVYSAMTAPIRRYQAGRAASMATEIARAGIERRVLEGRLSALEKSAISEKVDLKRKDALHAAMLIADEIALLPSVVSPRLMAEDVTAEKLTGLLAEHGGRMAVLSSEGDLFGTIAGRYSGGVGNFGVFLKGYSDPLITVDRVSRAAEVVPWPALTMALTVQPSVVAEIASSAAMRSRGLLARFLWAMPASMVGYRAVLADPAAPQGREEYGEILDTLLAMPADPAADDSRNWRTIALSRSASAQLLAFRRMIEPRQRRYADLADIADWVGKLAGNAARIMGLLHLASNHQHPAAWTLPITGETAAAALQIARWSIPHAEAALTPRISDHDDAEHVLSWLLGQPADVLTQSQIHRGAKRRGWTIRDHTGPILEKLADRHWIRTYNPPKQDKKRGRGRPARRWQINPIARCMEAK